MLRCMARLTLAAFYLLVLTVAVSAGEDWKPIDPAHVAMKSPVVEKDADAEILIWEVRIDDADRFELIFNHYIRIKVFTERGKETQSKIDIPYFDYFRVVDVAGRTIKPDGSIAELKKDAVFDRTVVKISGLRLKAKSFAMPAVEPGAIIEYRWREIRPFASANNVRIQFQRDIPVQSVKYFIKPGATYSNQRMSSRMFNGQAPGIVKERDGFYSMTMTNVPAFHEEPRMPPEDQVRMWMLIFYSSSFRDSTDDYWQKFGKEIYDENKPAMKVNDDTKRAAAEAIGDATTPEQKLERLFNYVRSKVKNVNDDASGLTATDREKMKENNSPADTLKRGIGTGRNINMLFAAMANASGLDARLALSADRSDIFFDPSFPNPYFLRASSIAVKVGEGWRFFDPASSYVPFGMMRWQEEGMSALVSDPKAGFFVETPLSPASKSLERRTAKLKLTEDGTLEGEVRIEYTGHSAQEKKEANDEDSQTQREENLTEMIKARMSTAEVTNINIENVTDPAKPFIYSFHLRVPGYAQRTGKRLFLQPAFFQRGRGPLFSASERKHAIYFHYSWTEEDSVQIALPRGYELDNAESPGPFRASNVCEYQVSIKVVNKNETLLLERKFNFTASLFPVTSYRPLKQVFDMLLDRDQHTITLKQAAAASN